MRALSSGLILIVMAFTLVACGGANSDNDSAKTNNANEVSDNKDAAKPENTANEPQVTEPAKPDANGKLAATMDIELAVEGNVETRTGSLAVSDNGYYLYTLPQFKFTPEEPSVDQVYMEKFEDYYMRIITLGADPDLTEIRASAEEELAMLGDVVELTGDQIDEPALRDSTFYLRSSDSTISKYIILRKIENNYLKIIVNMPIGEALDGAGPSFPAMIKTIQPTRP